MYYHTITQPAFTNARDAPILILVSGPIPFLCTVSVKVNRYLKHVNPEISSWEMFIFHLKFFCCHCFFIFNLFHHLL